MTTRNVLTLAVRAGDEVVLGRLSHSRTGGDWPRVSFAHKRGKQSIRIFGPVSRLTILPNRMCNMCRPIIHSARGTSTAVLLTAILLAFGPLCTMACQAAITEPLFAPPPLDQSTASEVFLVSTRAVGMSCDTQRLSERLICQRYEINEQGNNYWNRFNWRHLLQDSGHQRIVVYVHGNRVNPGEDIARGMKVYRSLCAAGKGRGLRFIIWSWPSSSVPGPIKDVHIKAARTRPAGWQLAWFLDQLPEETPVSLFGFSFGARVISGSLHILGGGTLGNLSLPERVHPQRPPFLVGMVAAAYDADWLQPGHFHQRAITQMKQLVLVTNHRDPAMRLYHFSVDRGRIHAMGKHGLARPQTLGEQVRRIRSIDVTSQVGRSHILDDYLSAKRKMKALWNRLVPTPANQRSAENDRRLGQDTAAAHRYVIR